MCQADKQTESTCTVVCEKHRHRGKLGFCGSYTHTDHTRGERAEEGWQARCEKGSGSAPYLNEITLRTSGINGGTAHTGATAPILLEFSHHLESLSSYCYHHNNWLSSPIPPPYPSSSHVHTPFFFLFTHSQNMVKTCKQNFARTRSQWQRNNIRYNMKLENEAYKLKHIYLQFQQPSQSSLRLPYMALRRIVFDSTLG